jgi:hypothetical protein
MFMYVHTQTALKKLADDTPRSNSQPAEEYTQVIITKKQISNQASETCFWGNLQHVRTQ